MSSPSTASAHVLHVGASAAERRKHAAAFLTALEPKAPALLLVPTPNAGLWLMADAIACGQARFGWRRLTLEQYCHALAHPVLLAEGCSYAGPVAAQALCARVVQELSEQGALGRFAAVSVQPGFTRALWSSVSDLRMAMVPPEALASLDPDLARVAKAFEQALQQAKLKDLSALYRLAADQALARVEPNLLSFDVPIEHAVQAALVRALGGTCTRACVTIVQGDSQSLDAFAAALPYALHQTHALPATDDLGRVQARLFEAAPTAEPAQPAAPRVHFLSSPGESRECVEVARAVLDAARSGVAFDRMAVLVRAVDNYRAYLEEALARAGIEAHFATGVSRPAPEGRAFALLLQCADGDLCVHRFAEYLSLAVMPKQTRDSHDSSAAARPRHWERLLVHAQVGGSSAAWQKQLQALKLLTQDELQLASLDTAQREALTRRVEALDALLAFAIPLLERLEALPARANFRSFRQALSQLAELALDKPGSVQELLSQLSTLDDTELGRRALYHLLVSHLQNLIVPGEGSGAGKLQVLPIDEARGRSFERVFVLGLAEQLMPPRLREDPLLPDNMRAALGPALARMPQRVARERLTLRIAVGAASDQLHLSFPRFDTEHNRPRVPSFYGLEVIEAVDGRLPAWTELAERASKGAAAKLGWPAPTQPEEAVDDAEYDLAMIAQAHSDPERTGALRYLLETNAHLARALRFRARRWELQKLKAADGFVVTDERAREALALFLEDYEHSASTLELLAICPYRFYLRALARVSALDQPASAAELDARERGVLFHKLLHETLGQLEQPGQLGDPPAAFDREAAARALEQSLSRQREARLARTDKSRARVLDIELSSLQHDLVGWLDEQSREGRWQPRATELHFGHERAAGPVTLERGLRLSGAIDLVEQMLQAPASAETPTVLRATDLKTGRMHARLERDPRYITSGGHILQPLLYALALERLYPNAQVSSGRLYYCTRQEHYASRPVELNERTRAVAAQLAENVQELVSQGMLPAMPEADACSGCEYQVICGPHEAERVQRIKQREPRALSLIRRLQ